MLNMRALFVALLTSAIVVSSAFAHDKKKEKPEPKRRACGPVLILHDSCGEFGWIGRLHAKMVANLLGHFQIPYQIQPVETYRSGKMQAARATFYLGLTFENKLPQSFLRDVLNTENPVCWFKYNLQQLAGCAGSQFERRFGFRFEYMDSAGYPVVHYKGETLSKNQIDRELGRVTILNSARTIARATASTLDGQSALPYVIQSCNFWYVADTPFAYIGEDDRYIAFTDLLHDILEIDHAESRRALIRIDEINPSNPPELLRALADVLHEECVPFLLSVTPVYTDPLGVFNSGVPQTYSLLDVPAVVDAIDYMVAKGGQVVLHGYTHQYRDLPNPYNGVTASDYEFFRVTLDEVGNLEEFHPVPEDSIKWVLSRLVPATRTLKGTGLSYVAWETPNFGASALDYRLFGALFPLTIQRGLYFDSKDCPVQFHRRGVGRECVPEGTSRSAGQFFPYVIERDIYGQKIVPDNLGHIDPFLADTYTASDLIEFARKNQVVRDGWASAFVSPFIDLNELRQLIRGVKAQGYTYVRLPSSQKLRDRD